GWGPSDWGGVGTAAPSAPAPISPPGSATRPRPARSSSPRVWRAPSRTSSSARRSARSRSRAWRGLSRLSASSVSSRRPDRSPEPDRGHDRGMARRQWFERFFDADYVALLRDTSPARKTRREVDFLVRSLRLPAGARILDVPCGYGRHAAELARLGFRVVGVDLSRAMIAEARRRWTEGPRLRFIQKDMRRLRAAGEFDAVINMYTSFG